MSRWRLTNVEVEGRIVDVDLGDGRILAISPAGGSSSVGEVLDGRGGALIPGLHDHHVHLLALAAAADSVDCGPDRVSGAEALGRLLLSAPQPDGWVRGTGYHESAAGELVRDALDRLVPDRPVRIQHRSGALWMLNTMAFDRVRSVLVDAHGRYVDGVEVDAEGRPTGRLWRLDRVLATAVPQRRPDLAALGSRLRGLGITGVTDATPDLTPATATLLADAVADGTLPLRVTVLGIDSAPEPLASGPAKILLPDHVAPDFDSLVALIRHHRSHGRAVAVHCVTRESLVLTVAALDEVGPQPGDRIEHGAVIPMDVIPELVRLGVRVITQPDFLRSRGERYLADVDASDLPCLYPYASLVAHGVPVAASSDAPFGEADPWQVIASAARRMTLAGAVIGAPEVVSPQVALSGYLSAAGDPGGQPRRVTVGDEADLVLLDVPLAEALAVPSARHVRLSVLRDSVVWRTSDVDQAESGTTLRDYAGDSGPVRATPHE